MTDIFIQTTCREIIKLEPKHMTNTASIGVILLEKLQQKVEGKCTKHGYIKIDSCVIKQFSVGQVELGTLSGFVCYDVLFDAKVCNPFIGTIVKGQISNTNRLGLFANMGYNKDGSFISILEIVIAKNSSSVQSVMDLSTIEIGDIVDIEIIGKKFELGDKKICAIGKVVDNTTPTSIKKKADPTVLQDMSDNEEDDVEIDDDVLSEEDADVENDEEPPEEDFDFGFETEEDDDDEVADEVEDDTGSESSFDDGKDD
jgi:DNA-directed RNA polymerase II subunit RPB7